MDEYYQRFLTNMSGIGGMEISSPDELSFAGMPSYVPTPIMHHQYHDLGHIGVFPDQSTIHPVKGSRGRKKSIPGGPFSAESAKAVKHRRTRSGCFTCRSRRVKCDETRPVCERCKKGNRDCVYPEPPSSKSYRPKDRSASPQRHSPKSSNDEDYDTNDADLDLKTKPLGAIEDEDENSCDGWPNEQDQKSPSIQTFRKGPISKALPELRRSSEDLSQDGYRTSSPSISTNGSTAAHQLHDANLAQEGTIDWSHLPQDYQHYLDYFTNNVTNFHYSIANDGEQFFGHILPALALRYEPLLNALVGFSAYHATLQNPNGRLEDFLKYYNKSVTLLLGTLQRSEANNIYTLVTILQLMTIEEYFGDWVNLMGHQKAAFQVLTAIFSSKSVMQTPVGRTCVNWYSRYDTYVAIMGGFPTDLPKTWFLAMEEHNRMRSEAESTVLPWKVDHRASQLRSISQDMSLLYARGSRGQIDPLDFKNEHARIKKALEDFKLFWDAELLDPKYLVADDSYHGNRDPDPDDIVNPYAPGLLYGPPLFTNTLITAEWHSIMIMHLSQAADLNQHDVRAELAQHAYSSCQYFEAVEFWPQKPKGALISLQPCISISALFLPQDDRHQMWIRRKFALLDTMGFIHPTTRRVKMAQIFGDPSCEHWWLPNDEGFTPVLQRIRAFADERNTAAVNAQQESLREVRHLFAKLEGIQ